MRFSARGWNVAEAWTSWDCMYLMMCSHEWQRYIITVKRPEHFAPWKRHSYSSLLKLFSSFFFKTLYQKKTVTHKEVESKVADSHCGHYVTAMMHQIIDWLSLWNFQRVITVPKHWLAGRREEQKWETEMKPHHPNLKSAHRGRTPPPDLWPSGPGASWTAGPCRPRRSRRATDCSRSRHTPRRPGPEPGTAGSMCRRSVRTASWTSLWAKHGEEANQSGAAGLQVLRITRV